MFEKNSLALGLVLGILIPLLGFSLFYGIFMILEAQGWVSEAGFRPMFRERTCGILALALNVALLNFYQKRYLQNSVRGVVAMTTLLIIVWIIVFGKYVF